MRVAVSRACLVPASAPARPLWFFFFWVFHPLLPDPWSGPLLGKEHTTLWADLGVTPAVLASSLVTLGKSWSSLCLSFSLRELGGHGPLQEAQGRGLMDPTTGHVFLGGTEPGRRVGVVPGRP